jgi:hypothetical protein
MTQTTPLTTQITSELAGDGGTNPTFEYNFGNQRIPSNLTFTRTSDAWYFNQSGFLTLAATNVARFDYDPVTREFYGLALEPTRLNRVAHNRNLTQAVWLIVNGTRDQNAVGLDGQNNSCTTITATSTNCTVLQIVTISASSRTFSIYLKRKTGTGGVDITQDGGLSWTSAGTLNTSSFVRVSLNASVLNPSVGIRIQTSGDEVIVDGAQLEDGAGSTSLIVTGASVPITRAAETLTGTLPSTFNQLFGSFITKFRFSQITATQRVIHIDDGTTNERYIVGLSTSNLRYTAIDGGSTNSNINMATSPVANTSYMVCGKYEIGTSLTYASVNDSFPVTGTNSVLPTVTTIRLGGNISGAEGMFGWILFFKYYNQRFSQAAVKGFSKL